MADNPDITAGTASVAAGTKAVTGVGTFWSTDEIRSGDLFASDGYPGARIDTVNSDTSITLRDNWRGSSLPAGSSYYIRYQPDGSRYAALLAGVRKILSLPNLTALSGLVGAAGRIPIFTGPGTMSTVDKLDLVTGVNADKKVATLAARAAYDGEAEGFSVLVANIGDGRSAIYFKNSPTIADWSPPAYLTGPNGSFQSKGNYNWSTTYAIGDVVLHNGSSWIARIGTLDNPPPNLPATFNAQWFLLAAAGSGFQFKGDYAGATAYLKDDVVLYNNSSWIALGPTTGDTPPALPTTSNAYWSLIAAKGAGDVSGPASASADFGVAFADATGKVLKSTGFLAGNVRGPATSVAGRMPAFADALGKLLVDSGYRAVQQGTGIGQSSNDIKLGWSPNGLKGTVDNTDLGKIWCDLAVGLTLSARGSLRLPNKITLQWARETNGVGNFNINYETAMSGTFAIAGLMDAEPGANEMYSLGVFNVSGTGFSARPRYTSGGSAGVATQPFFWMAIGYIA